MTKADDRYDLSRLSMLVVDDSAEVRRTVLDLLAGFGVGRRLEAPDGRSALEILAREWIDLLICDWIMSPMDGVELVRAVRRTADEQKAMIPAILVTAYADQPRLLAARDAGANEILLKPFTGERLYRKLIAVIESPRAFVRSPRYVGPDRRVSRDLDFIGFERRGEEPDRSGKRGRPGGSRSGKALH
jgi:CheY-like chemotaxis protein